MMYSATVFNDHLDEAMELLSEVILRPSFSQEEVCDVPHLSTD
jgi:predicted Zn-dependent peptidase